MALVLWVVMGKGYKQFSLEEGGRFLAVVYRELSPDDGFLITSYMTSKIRLDKEVVVWKRPA